MFLGMMFSELRMVYGAEWEEDELQTKLPWILQCIIKLLSTRTVENYDNLSHQSRASWSGIETQKARSMDC
jgi:hypothetical protein